MISVSRIMGAGLWILLAGACAWSQTLFHFPAPEILGPSGGDVRSLAIHPSNPRILFAGTTDGSLFKSEDGAQTWTRLRPGLNRRGLVIGRLSVETEDPETVYAAAWQLTTSGGGLFRSRDGGRSWEEILFDTAQVSVRALARAPGDPNRLFAGTLQGVYRSEDEGRTWKFLPGSAAIAFGLESLVVHPARPEVLLAGSRRMAYRSEDGGESWRPVVQGMQEDSDIFDLLVTGEQGGPVVAAACTGVFRSENGGLSWTHAGLGGQLMKERTRALAADPQSPGRLFAGTTAGLYGSRDGGASWEFLSGKHLVINAVAVDPQEPGTLYLAADNEGILKSTDGGRTFSRANQGLIHRSVSTLVGSRQEQGFLLMGVLYDRTEGGVFRSRDGGANWEPASRGIPEEARNVAALLQHPAEAAIFYAGTPAGLYVTRDAAESWSRVPSRLVPGSVAVLAGASDGGQTLILAGGSDGLFASRDGMAWQRLLPGDSRTTLSALIFLSGHPDRILAGSQGQTWVSEDGGRNWRISRLGLPSVSVQSLASPMGWDGPWFLGNRYGVFRSLNQGRSWDHVAADLGASDVTSLTHFTLPHNAGRGGVGRAGAGSAAQTVWVVGADVLSAGLLISADGGENWHRAGLADAGSRIWSLWVDALRGPRLLAGTASDGIYAFDLTLFQPGVEHAAQP